MALVTGTLGLSLEMGAFLAGLTVRFCGERRAVNAGVV